MKNSSKSWVVVGLGLVLATATIPARAELEVAVGVNIHAASDFYKPLGAQGTWVEVGSYGRCWRPAHVAAEWQPYCEGSWEWTDNGWYWQTSESWGWATYHYGSWVYAGNYWAWVPGVEWAPAWVSWRHGGGYVGWAPLGPNHVVVEGPRFVFVNEGHFHEPIRRSTVVVNNTTVINKTVVINNVHQETRGSSKVVINEGPGLAQMQRATGNKFKTVAVATAAQRTVVPKEVKRTTTVQKPTAPQAETKAVVARDHRSEPVKVQPRKEPAKTEIRQEPGRAEQRHEANPIEPKSEPAHVTQPNRALPPEHIATEPPTEHAPVVKTAPREELRNETRPTAVEKATAAESTERLQKSEEIKQRPVTHPAKPAQRPITPVRPPQTHEAPKPAPEKP